MLFSKIKDLNKRKNLLKLEYKLKSQKFVFINLVSKLNYVKKIKKVKRITIYKALYSKLFLKKNVTKVKLVRRCLITNRARSVYRSFNISRILFRDLLQFGLIPGYKKAVW